MIIIIIMIIIIFVYFRLTNATEQNKRTSTNDGKCLFSSHFKICFYRHI